MSQTNLDNVTEQVVNDTVAPVVDAVEETTTAAVQETEVKRKSFFDIFKKKKSTVEKDAEAEVPADEAAAATEEAAAVEEAAAEVPVEEKPAKKCRMCGLCAFGK